MASNDAPKSKSREEKQSLSSTTNDSKEEVKNEKTTEMDKDNISDRVEMQELQKMKEEIQKELHKDESLVDPNEQKDFKDKMLRHQI